MTGYKESAEFPGYRAGTDGSVWSSFVLGSKSRRRGEWRLMTPTLNRRCGYLYVDLKRAGGRVNKRVNVFIIETFVGPAPPGMECRHENGDRTDNRLENLLWGTRTDNMLDAIGHGTIARGSRHHSAKLDERDIPLIRAYQPGVDSLSILARIYGVSTSVISEIITGKAWKHVGRKP
jgi:hypothetical protein